MPNSLLKPQGIGEDFWKKLLSKVEEISSCEKVECDVCLIGSYARGDASPISDIDLVIFAEGQSNLKQTELFYIDERMITIFSVNVPSLLMAESTDFYNANNPFEAKLIHGNGKVLDTLRKGAFRKRIDLSLTKKVTGSTVSTRLMSALSDAALDYGEGVRNMRMCLAKVKLYTKLFKEAADPWSIIPYNYKPEGELENLTEKLYHSENYEELSTKITKLNLRELMTNTFGEHIKTMVKVAEKITGEVEFAGRHVKNYVSLYLIVEESVRSVIWNRLPGRWKTEEELNSKVNHYHTYITCGDERVWWILSTGEGESLKLEHYGTTEF